MLKGEKVKESLKEYWDNKIGKKREFSVECFSCGTSFKVEERENKFPIKEKYFCSRSCANKREWNDEDKLKKSLPWQKKTSIEQWTKNRENRKRRALLTVEERHLMRVNAGKKAVQTSRKNRNWKGYDKNEIGDYRRLCQFKFLLKDFPDEFDLTLFQLYGTYKAKNKGDNLKGVVRDHRFSIQKGFENNIDPYYISHPANCELIRGDENIKKRTKCTLSIKELYERVENWNKKYGVEALVDEHKFCKLEVMDSSSIYSTIWSQGLLEVDVCLSRSTIRRV